MRRTVNTAKRCCVDSRSRGN